MDTIEQAGKIEELGIVMLLIHRNAMLMSPRIISRKQKETIIITLEKACSFRMQLEDMKWQLTVGSLQRVKIRLPEYKVSIIRGKGKLLTQGEETAEKNTVVKKKIEGSKIVDKRRRNGGKKHDCEDKDRGKENC
jgi:hypothetical protein